MNTPLSQILLRDVVTPREFPAVVQAAEVRELREIALSKPESKLVGDFTGGYLGVDDRSRVALEILLRALGGSGSQAGGAFFLNGVFGAGKSHLLGVLALLCDHAGHRAFRDSHAHLAPLVGKLLGLKYLGAHFSLDDYAPSQWSLEDIVWRELAAECARQKIAAPPFDAVLSRREQWDALADFLVENGRGGLLLCVDELSLFLSARPHAGLQSDAAFLQFLGQRARLGSGFSLCVAAALQKTVDDIGGIEAYSVHQIRDRFVTLQLSLAHVPVLIQRRVVQVEDEAARDAVARETWAQVLEALPRFEGDEDEWRRLMPFHPPAIALLESIVSRFLSRTRSAVLFCTESLRLKGEGPASARIGLPELFDYVWPEVENHPDLRRLAEVWREWQSDLAGIAGQPSDVPLMRLLMQGLVLFKVAGFAADVPQLCHALCFDAGLREGNYAFAQVLLERLRSRGGHVTLEKQADGADRWSIDAGLKTTEVARRALRSLVEQIPPGDERLSRHAIACCRSSLLPLSLGGEARSQLVTWRNAPRSVAWRLWSGSENEVSWAANQVAALSQPGHADDWLLLVAPPFGRLQDAREALDNLAASLSKNSNSQAGRWRERVALWMPRQPFDDEWLRAREAAAGALLREDPQLLDNKRGRAILHYVAQEQEPREALLERVCVRLLREGELIAGDGAAIDAGDLALGEGWAQHVESVAQWALEGVFPRFKKVAPRARVLTPSVADQLCLEALRRPPEAPFYAPSLERAVRAVAEPLGAAREHEGRWHIAAGREEIVADMEDALDSLGRASSTWGGAADEPERESSSVAVSALEARFAKGEWGLRPEQFALALCLLLRDGRWQALDSRGAPLVASRLGMPLRRSAHAVRRGQKLERGVWESLAHAAQVLAEASGSDDLRPLAAPERGGFEAQEKAHSALLAWLEGARLDCESLRARAHQLARQLGHSSEQWRPFGEAMSRAEAVFSLNASLPASQFLGEFAALAGGGWLQHWREAKARGEALQAKASDLVQAHAFLTSAELSVPPELADSRQEILEKMARGEDVLSDDSLLAECESWREKFGAAYREWHAAQNNPARWLSVERALAADDLRVLPRLESLAMAEFGGARLAREALEEERSRRCPHDGSGGSWSPCCPACRLPWGQRLAMRPLEELLAPAHADLARLAALLQDASVRERLGSSGPAAQNWLSWNGEAASLAPLTTPESLRVLDEALRPRRVFERRAGDLPQVLAGCKTRIECERAFARWLDGGDALRPDDEILWA